MAQGGADAQEDASDRRVGRRPSRGLSRLAPTGELGAQGWPRGQADQTAMSGHISVSAD